MHSPNGMTVEANPSIEHGLKSEPYYFIADTDSVPLVIDMGVN